MTMIKSTRLKNLLFLLLITGAALFVPFGNRAAADDRFSLAFPRDNTYVEGELIDIVVNAWPTETDQLRVSVNGKQALVAPYKKYTSCFSGIKLTFGMNTITVDGFKNGKQTHTVSIRVYYRTDLKDDSSVPPDGFPRYLFHTAKNEKQCLDCHDFYSNDEQQETSSCKVCHGKIVSDYKFAHGPSAVWSCLICHDPKSKNPRFAVASPIGPVCANCHENSWDTMKHKHAPTAAGACTVCHNPHASDQQYFLQLKLRSLCIACHPEILTRPHVISGITGQGGHPLLLAVNPFQPDKPFTCASCHSPHGGNSSVFLWNYDEDKMPLKTFCLSCHRW